MGNVVNLNRFRKRSERDASSKKADANRAKFGRSKSDRSAQDQRSRKAKELLDQHRIEREDQQ